MMSHGKLTAPVVESLKVVKICRDNSRRINTIDFSAKGDYMITSSDDDQIIIYDCEKQCCISRATKSNNYGVDLVRFTHADNAVLHCSTKVDDSIRHLSLYDIKYLRYFPGHTKKVVSLSMSPLNDTFISSSWDKTVRLWDLRSPNCEGLLNVPGERPVTAIDPEGLVFAVGVNSEYVKIYDFRNVHKGPFTTFRLNNEEALDWTEIKFARNGNAIVIGTNGSITRLIDAFHGTPLQSFGGYNNSKRIPIESCLSPDSKYIFSGSCDGLVHVWDTDTGYKICVLNADHPGPVQYVQFNPKYMMLASACTKLAFWIPTYEGEPQL